MLKRTAVLVGLLSMCLIAGVSSFSRSYIIGKAELHVAGPRHALISVYENESVSIAGNGVCTPGVITVRNNQERPITITSLTCQNDALAGLLHIDVPAAQVPSGQYGQVLISLDSGQSLENIPMEVPFQLEAQWDGGKAVIDFKATIQRQTPSPEIIMKDATLTGGITEELPALPTELAQESQPHAPQLAEQAAPSSTEPTQQLTSTSAEAGE